MSALPSLLAASLLQSSGSVDRETLLVIFVGIIALVFLGIALAGIALIVVILKLKKDVTELANSIKAKAMPIIESSNGLVRDLTPKVRKISDDVTEITKVVRAQVANIDSTISDLTSKTRAQTDRVNGLVSQTLDTTTHVANTLESGIKAPLREISGLVAGVKTGLDVLLGRGEPGVKAKVKTAESHLTGWEQDVKAEAVQAARVNAPATQTHVAANSSTMRGEPGAGASQAVAAETATGAAEKARRSVVEAGDELATNAAQGSERLKEATQTAKDDVLRSQR